MQQIYAWLDIGDGLQPVNDHTQDIAVLDDVSIQWGADEPGDQPDPSVASFRLIDHNGILTGQFVRLAMARFALTMSREPQWRDLTRFGRWRDVTVNWADLPGAYRPDGVNADGSVALFDGLIATGGTVSAHGDDWLLDLTASSRMILWARNSKQGPVSGDWHWTGTPKQRLDELNSRAAALGAPLADTTDVRLPDAVAPYDLDTYPSLLDLLHRLTAHDGRMLVWHDHASGDATSIAPTSLAEPAGLIADAAGGLWTQTGDDTRPAIPSSAVRTPDGVTMTIREPVTSVTVQARRASCDDQGKLTFDQSDLTYTCGTLPDNLTATANTVSVESDAIVASTESAYPAWQPDDEDRARMALMVETIDRVMTPETVVFDSRSIDPTRWPELFHPEPSGPVFAVGPVFARLTDDQGNPAASCVWTTFGGTWRFRWENGDPVITNEASLLPLPAAGFDMPVWADLDGWPPPWSAMRMTWAQTRLIGEYRNTIMERTATI